MTTYFSYEKNRDGKIEQAYRVQVDDIPGLARVDKTPPRRVGVALKPPRFVAGILFSPRRREAERKRLPGWPPAVPPPPAVMRVFHPRSSSRLASHDPTLPSDDRDT